MTWLRLLLGGLLLVSLAIIIPFAALWIVSFGAVILAFTMRKSWFTTFLEGWHSFWKDPVEEDLLEFEMGSPMSDPDDNMPASLRGLIPALDEEARYAALPSVIRSLVEEGHSVIEIELNPSQALQLADDIDLALSKRTSPAG